MTAAKTISAEEFDRRFDNGEDVSEFLDWSTFRRPGLEPKRINLDVPQAMAVKLEAHARKRGVTRQALIKMWLADRLEAAG
jgi:CopG antitoxin of type II toxin-antitoxin system